MHDRHTEERLTLTLRVSELYGHPLHSDLSPHPLLLMDVNTIILLLEALVIVGLSTFVWFGVQKEEPSTLHWAALFVLVLVLIGFAATMFSTPLALD